MGKTIATSSNTISPIDDTVQDLEIALTEYGSHAY